MCTTHELTTHQCTTDKYTASQCTTDMYALISLLLIGVLLISVLLIHGGIFTGNLGTRFPRNVLDQAKFLVGFMHYRKLIEQA